MRDRRRWIGVAVAIVLAFALTRASWSVQSSVIAAFCVVGIVYLARQYRRTAHDRAGRSAVLLMALVFGLFAVGVLIPGNAGYAVFLVGVALLLIGGVVLRRRRLKL